jgi:tetrahydromethanopterin S-methyltransferase subunit B
MSRSSNSNPNRRHEPNQKQHILWSCVARDDIILAEAGEDLRGGAVAETARQLLQRKSTAGWEFQTQQIASSSVGARMPAAWRNRKGAQPQTQLAQSQSYSSTAAPQQRLKGVKFHLYETVPAEGNDDYEDNITAERSSPSTTRIWVFAAVYDPSLIDKVPVQSFLEKMIGISELFRETDHLWKEGGTLACQNSFAPMLLQRMQEVTSLGKMAMLHDQLTMTQQIMSDNIALILENDEQLHDMQENSSRLQEMAHVFKKRTKAVRRAKMMQNAKHGLILGTVITAGVAIIVVPPLVALL